MKKTIEKVHGILTSSDWDAEWNHPHKWNDADILLCTTKLEDTNFSKKHIGECLDHVLEEAAEEYRNRENTGTFVELLAEYIADYVAWYTISKSNGKLYAPESATFHIIQSK